MPTVAVCRMYHPFAQFPTIEPILGHSTPIPIPPLPHITITHGSTAGCSTQNRTEAPSPVPQDVVLKPPQSVCSVPFLRSHLLHATGWPLHTSQLLLAFFATVCIGAGLFRLTTTVQSMEPHVGTPVYIIHNSNHDMRG